MTDSTFSTANLADAFDRLRLSPRHAPLTPISPGMRLAGPARPVIHRGSVDVFFAAMEEAQPGDVLVIDNEGRLDEGCIGDLTVLEAQIYKLAGVVVFGAHRDTAELREIVLPVFSMGACALGPRGLRPAQNRIASVHGITITPLDMVIADDDGVLFVEAAHAARITEAAREIRDKERRQADLVRQGTSLHQQFQWTVLENTHDRPYVKGAANGPEIVSALSIVGAAIRRATPLPLGIQVLAGANRAAIAVAHACGAAFVRVEGFVFAHVADEGVIESSAGDLLRYRRAIGAENVLVFADIKKKHSAHAITADVDIVETAKAAASSVKIRYEE